VHEVSQQFRPNALPFSASDSYRSDGKLNVVHSGCHNHVEIKRDSSLFNNKIMNYSAKL